MNPYPFPTPGNDELQERFGIEPRPFSTEQLDRAAAKWLVILDKGPSADLYIALVSAFDGDLTDSTIVWDAIKTHSKLGLHKFIERSGAQYKAIYKGVSYLEERRCQRAFQYLAEVGVIHRWPQANTIGQKFRLDWVEVSNRLDALQGSVLPGLDGLQIKSEELA